MDGFNSTFSHRGQHHGQRQVPTDVCADILWLRVGFSTRFDAVGVAHWHRRLRTFLSGCGLTAAMRIPCHPGHRSTLMVDSIPL